MGAQSGLCFERRGGQFGRCGPSRAQKEIWKRRENPTRGNFWRRRKTTMSVNYRKVVNDLTDVIKELNVPCAEAAAAERSRSQEERQRDAVGVVKALLGTLEQARAPLRPRQSTGAPLRSFPGGGSGVLRKLDRTFV